MAAGDFRELKLATITADSVVFRMTGYAQPIPISQVTVVADSTEPSGNVFLLTISPVGGSWPTLTTANGTASTNGEFYVEAAGEGAAAQVEDIYGKKVAGGTRLWSNTIALPDATPVVVTIVTAEYVSGLGATGQTLTTADALASFGNVTFRFKSTEQ